MLHLDPAGAEFMCLKIFKNELKLLGRRLVLVFH